MIVESHGVQKTSSMPELPTQQNLDLTDEVADPDIGGNSDASKFIPKKKMNRYQR